MCFIKSAPSQPIVQEVQEPLATRKQADASITKNNANQASRKNEAIKTSPMGLTTDAVTEKKTLLGE